MVCATAGPAGAADRLEARITADSLNRSARDILLTTNAPKRAARLVDLCRFARRLDQANPQTLDLLARVIYPSQHRPEDAAKALEAYLAVRGGDHAAGLRWLDLSLTAQNTAEARLAHLARVSGDTSRPAALRAEAEAQRGQILAGQGQTDAAGKAFDRALELDAGSAVALAGRMNLLPGPTTVQRVEALLADLRANAGQAATANELADLLQALGLHTQALVYYTHLDVLANRPGSTGQARHLAAVRLFNAMLDAGQAQQVVKTLPKVLVLNKRSVDLRSMLVEACRTVGDDEQATEQISAIEQIYTVSTTDPKVSPAQAGELAMFFLLTKPNAEKALKYARLAARQAGEDPVAQRLLGAAEIASKDPALVRTGTARLAKAAAGDLYAAALLARHYAETGDRAGAQRAVDASLKLPRGGPAGRLLAAIARKAKIPLTPAAESKDVTALLAAADGTALLASADPGKFVTVTLEPVGETMIPGRDLTLAVTLTNIAKIPVPLGTRGLVRPVVKLEVAVAGSRNARTYDDLPLCVMPAPRYLQPGKSVRAVVRLDVGRLGRLLAATPLTELTLTVKPTVAPVKPFGRIISAVPTLNVAPLKITRSDLLGAFDRTRPDLWASQYAKALETIKTDLTGADVLKRVTAARQTAALLAVARGIERRAAKAPEPLSGRVSKAALLPLLRQALNDASFAVRAETVAAMANVSLDRHILPLLTGAARDPHPLVRFRLAELLGASRSVGVRTTMKALAADDDDLVRSMAQTFLSRR